MNGDVEILSTAGRMKKRVREEEKLKTAAPVKLRPDRRWSWQEPVGEYGQTRLTGTGTVSSPPLGGHAWDWWSAKRRQGPIQTIAKPRRKATPGANPHISTIVGKRPNFMA